MRQRVTLAVEEPVGRWPPLRADALRVVEWGCSPPAITRNATSSWVARAIRRDEKHAHAVAVDGASIAPALDLCDRVVAMLWRLTH